MSFIPTPNGEEEVGWLEAMHAMFFSQYNAPPSASGTPSPIGRYPSQCGFCKDCKVSSVPDHCWVCEKEYSPPFSDPWSGLQGPDYSQPNPFLFSTE